MEKHLKEQKQENMHLEQCLKIIQENIHLYEEKERRYKKEVTELFQAVKKGEGDSYGAKESLYIGKNGITQNANEVIIVDRISKETFRNRINLFYQANSINTKYRSGVRI